jgi:hypothetical protein
MVVSVGLDWWEGVPSDLGVVCREWEEREGKTNLIMRRFERFIEGSSEVVQLDDDQDPSRHAPQHPEDVLQQSLPLNDLDQKPQPSKENPNRQRKE